MLELQKATHPRTSINKTWTQESGAEVSKGVYVASVKELTWKRPAC